MLRQSVQHRSVIRDVRRELVQPLLDSFLLTGRGIIAALQVANNVKNFFHGLVVLEPQSLVLILGKLFVEISDRIVVGIFGQIFRTASV
jgi:hypothetical protein